MYLTNVSQHAHALYLIYQAWHDQVGSTRVSPNSRDNNLHLVCTLVLQVLVEKAPAAKTTTTKATAAVLKFGLTSTCTSLCAKVLAACLDHSAARLAQRVIAMDYSSFPSFVIHHTEPAKPTWSP